MNLCDSIHEEICWERGSCPLCKALATIDDLQEELSKSNDYSDELYRKLEAANAS